MKLQNGVPPARSAAKDCPVTTEVSATTGSGLPRENNDGVSNAQIPAINMYFSSVNSSSP